MEIKTLFNEALLKSLLGFLSDITKLVVNGTIKPEELVANPEVFALVYVGLQTADRFFGENEDQAHEIVVDELKDAMKSLAKQHNIPVVEMYWD